ncbi:hypothetical protein ANO11243_050110 [Dothideomycetidae sp. 11243]|nr:hypothetical protein ANO11243_050110 [fungal sp. No.11243]
MAGLTRLWLLYVADWLIVVVFAVAGAVLNRINGYHRPFTLSDASIAFPLKPDIVSLPLAGVVSGVGPVVVIALSCLLSAFVRHHRALERGANVFRRAAWEVNVGWLGLAFALATTLFITSGLKDMVGKPRPDLLARCVPDLANIEKYAVGGLGTTLDSEAALLVSSAICQQTDNKVLYDGFAAFPSGHSSFSSAGMVYLSLWLCAHWSVAIPFMDYYHPRHFREDVRNKAAAPPLWQVAVCLAPVGVALFICSTRYADFHHAGVDIVAGAALGTVLAWFTFRLFHLPIRRGRGSLAWGPRSSDHAFLAPLKSSHKLRDEERGEAGDNYELRDINHLDTEPSPSSNEPLAGEGHRPISAAAT